ncbi:unnamed protein product [Symbiodinium natans]|uniref:Peptidase M41 domain-containing protein n=1 Tax=Symbiodinium natans TaxID=878477 RepID=A0A812IEI4_9DINO|nr:unnamed protein product [Symbiodinium natans]
MSWSRYHESSSQSWPPSASEDGVTPFSRYPLQDGFYNTLAYTHVVIGFSYVALMLWQFLATKGTPGHVKRGGVLKWIALLCIGGGWALQIRHSWFSNPTVFEKHPASTYPSFPPLGPSSDVRCPGSLRGTVDLLQARRQPQVLFSLPFAQNFVSAFGASTVASALNCYLVGVNGKSRASAHGPVHILLLIGTSVSLAADVNAYVYMFRDPPAREMTVTTPWSSYHWDMLVEMVVIGSVFPLYDGSLDYKEHHVMNAVWTMSKTAAAVLLFSAHDAHYFWTHPGLTLPYRLAVQLVPQLIILVPYSLRIFRYLQASRLPHSRRILLAMLAVDMGGRAAEELLLGKGQATMGAQADIDDATRLAMEMVASGGLSKAVGPRALQTGGIQPSQALLSEVDAEVKELLDKALLLAATAIAKNRELHSAVAEVLIQHETLDGEEFQRVVREHPPKPIKL